MLARELKRLSVILVLSLILAGCGSSLSGGLPGPQQPVNPGDDSLPGGDGPVSLFQGKVVFGDTGRGLRSTVTFKTETVVAETGEFQLNLAHGTNEYVIRNLLGEYRGSVLHDGAGRKNLMVPVFDGWGRDYFDQLLIVDGFNVTRRWPMNSEIPVWIEKQRDDRNVTAAGVNTVRAALDEWAAVLNGAIQFRETTNKSAARVSGITVEFISSQEMRREYPQGNVAGYCEYSYSNWRIVAGALYIRHDWQDSIALHLHEIGHCLGLRHSPDQDEVMYRVITHRDKRLTEREKNMARLLYSLPGGTPAFASPARMPASMALNDTTGRVRIHAEIDPNTQ